VVQAIVNGATDLEKALRVLKRKVEAHQIHRDKRVRRSYASPRGRKRNKRLRLFPICFQFLEVMFPWEFAPFLMLSYLSYTSKV
jgi:ribosomal protein S21